MALKYLDAATGHEQFNGNIGEMNWIVAGDGLPPGFNGGEQGYDFTYDPMSRLTGAEYSSMDKADHYNVSGLSYDLNGNIASLSRNKDNVAIDQLSYDYGNSGNQLQSVSDAGTSEGFEDGNTTGPDYVYDANGNMIEDKNKGITVSYNHMNLPDTVLFSTGDTTFYAYDAAGVKLRKRYKRNDGTEKITDYNNGIHYEQDFGETEAELKFVQTAEGRYAFTGSNLGFQYDLKDHLGNTRVTVNESGEAIQAQDYYPFGMTFNEFNNENKYLYNGKEKQDETQWYDYGFRSYDPVTSRWYVIDPKVEKYYDWSPYNYVMNNPMINIDPRGDTVKYVNEETRAFVERYTSETVTTKKGKVKKNRNYHEGFANLISSLDNADEVFLFTNEGAGKNNDQGEFSYDGKEFTVNFGEPDATYGGATGLMFEETFHAGQFLDGKVYFNKTSSGWTASAVDAGDEYDAKRFASSAPGVKFWYGISDETRAETQLGLISKMNRVSGVKYLTQGVNKDYGQSNITYNAPYPNLRIRLSTKNSPYKVKTVNTNTYAYPSK